MVSDDCKKLGVSGAFPEASPNDLYFLPQGVIMNHQLYLKNFKSYLILLIEKITKKI